MQKPVLFSFFYLIITSNILLSQTDNLIYPEEKNFKSLRQITFGGDNAETYWNNDDTKLVFQSNNSNWGVGCDQIFIIDKSEDLSNKKPKMISTGKGRTTCAYFMPDGNHIIYASTHLGNPQCPESPLRFDGKYVWPIYETYDIFVSDLEGNITKQLTSEIGYDAEATVSPKGDKIVFTSMRTGDLELFTMDIDGSNVKQITNDLGYDGGAFFSPDGSKIIFRASRPKSKQDIEEYQSLLKKGFVQPTDLEIFVVDADGSNLKQVTYLGNANWSPFWHPSGDKILFSSNFEAEAGFPFNIYMIDINGRNLKRVTYDNMFDSFPVFSNNGKYLIFASNRNNGGNRDTNVFIAEWID
ncbi:hypothetical protein EB155_13610 [archaeon]|nr:hypothetical protein [archaeon]